MKNISYFFIFSAFLCSIPAFSQTPFPAVEPVFEDVLPRVDIFLPPDSLGVIYAPGNEQSNYHFHATFIFNHGDFIDTLENVGFRLRGNTSRFSAKKSFKVSFNTYEPGRKWYGLEKLNLNGEHNDPTIIRSKICWDLARWMGIPAPRSNHVDLYINGDHFGLYINVEHIDEEFVQLRFGNNDGNLYKCLWGSDLNYKGNDPNLYKGGSYTLKTNEAADDFSDLAHFIDILNNTSIEDLPCELEQVFNVDSYLKSLVLDILTGNWDGPLYNKNNFYLYKNVATGKFEYIPYDLDNTLGIDWLNRDWGTRNIYDWGNHGEPRPLYWNLIEVPEYRERFSYYMALFTSEFFEEDFLFPHIETLKSMIENSAQMDIFRTLDYGFTFDDFLDSYEEELPFFQTDYGLKPYITTRRDETISQLETIDIHPIITNVSNNFPNSFQDIVINAVAIDNGVVSAEVCYQLDGQNLTCVPLFDDGTHADGNANDAVFGAIIEALGTPAVLEYYINATDDAGQESRKPVCEWQQIFIGSSSIPVVVNELMASNNATLSDEEGEFDDWIELFNLGADPVYLGERYLSDDPNDPTKWQFPDVWIQPNEYLLIWADNDEDQGALHTNFKLSVAGEFVGLFDDMGHNFAQIDGINFEEQTTDISFARLPNGTGTFQVATPTPGGFNEPIATQEVDNDLINLSVFPNPFSNQMTFSARLPFIQPVSIQVQDAFGRVIFELKETVNAIDKDIDTTTWANGLYFVAMQLEDGRIQVKKVVLQ